MGSSSNQITLDIFGEKHSYELLRSFEFNSDRKRMSILIRDQGVIKLFIKGADSVIKSLLNENVEQPFKKFCEKKIDDYSKVGLRCLCIAMKIISEEEYQKFYSMAKNKTSEQICQHTFLFALLEIFLVEMASIIEKDLVLIGVTAVEDKLQDEVPETINDLLMAGFSFNFSLDAS